MSDDRKTISDMIRAAWQRGEPAGWFEKVYASAEKGTGRIPWAQMKPNPALVEWAQQDALSGKDQRALVIGCGLGDDAEALAAIGFTVTAFDIAPTAIEMCKRRFPDSTVDYQVADLFDTPDTWAGAFDFIFESRTIQSLPTDLAPQTIAAIAAFTAPDGRIFIICNARDNNTPAHGIPWSLARADLAHFETNGLVQQSLEEFRTGWHHFRAVYQRPEAE